MENLKKADVILQALLIGYGITDSLLFTPGHQVSWFFALAAVQVISCLGHYAGDKSGQLLLARRIYNYCLLAFLISIGLLPVAGFYILFGWLIITPCMAICYFIICLAEWAAGKKRPITLLK